MDRFIIYKSTRAPRINPQYSGYSGPACIQANVQPGKVYLSEHEANADREKLNAVNPVGFSLYRF